MSALRTLAGLVLLCVTATAADPRLDTLVPRGARQGTEVDVTLVGQRLKDAAEILWFEPGIEVLSLEAKDDRTVRGRLRIAEDCRLGEHRLLLRTSTGLSAVKTFWVGSLPELAEQEPNPSPEQAQPVPLEVTINGVITQEDVDVFAIEVEEPLILSVEVQGVRLGDTPFDPHLTVLDAEGRTKLLVDDTFFGRLDPLGRVAIETPGRYTIAVRESAFGGNGRSHYRLHIGTFPIAVAALPAGGRPGDSATVRFIGSDRVWEQSVTFGDADLDYFVRDEHGVAPSPLRLASSPWPAVTENAREDFGVTLSPWRIIGPFASTRDSEGHISGHQTVYPPEEAIDLEAVLKGRDGEVRWTERPEWKDGTPIDLTQEPSASDDAVYYFHRTIESRGAQHWPMMLGSDDTLKVWLDGTLVHEHTAARGLNPDSDRVVLALSSGRHDLLVKVANGAGGFGFAMRPARRTVAELGTPMPMPGVVHGTIEKERETDFFRFHAEKDRELEFVVRARELRSPLDAVLQVRDLAGRGLVANDDSGGPDSRLRFKPPETGEYLLAIWDHLRRSGPDYVYRVECGPRRGERSIRVAVPGRPDEFAVAVPGQGRMATLLRLDGIDTRAGYRPHFEGLPEGVVAQVGTLQPGSSSVPVVFEAAEGVSLVGAQLFVTARKPDDDSDHPAPFRQPIELVEVENNQTFLETSVDLLTLAVCEPAPFTIEVEPPTVPIIQASPLGLTVRITRRAGFAGPVRARMLWNPPGLSSGEIVFEKDQTEKTLPINASGNAREGTWAIAIVGRANQGGERAASSALVELVVSKPWVKAVIGKVRVEQGQTASLPVEFETLQEGLETYEAKIVNLPREVTSEFPGIATGKQEQAYALGIGEKSPPGRHQNLLLRCVVPSPGGGVVHHFRGGELRIDKPLPPERRAAPKPAQQTEAAAAPPAKKPAKGTVTKPKT
ncbi:MAG: PPC domain-containing protein [Planctomycetota bacterium]